MALFDKDSLTGALGKAKSLAGMIGGQYEKQKQGYGGGMATRSGTSFLLIMWQFGQQCGGGGKYNGVHYGDS